MPKILSFDVSSVSTGWSFILGETLQEFGIITPSKNYRLQEKLYWFKNEVNALFKIYFPDYVLVEDTYLKNVTTLKVLMQFIGVINLECFFELGQDIVFLSPNTVRSHFKIKTKEDAFNLIKNKYKIKLKNYSFETGNDISDSILQGLYFLDILKESNND